MARLSSETSSATEAHEQRLDSVIRDCFPDARQPVAFACEGGGAGCFAGWAPSARGHSHATAQEAA
jgi:hypothetical protein